MKALLKVEQCNLPLSMPVEWREFFDQRAELLGISRNSALRMALKLGAPVLDSYVRAMKKGLEHECARVLCAPGIAKPLSRLPEPARSDRRTNHEHRKQRPSAR